MTMQFQGRIDATTRSHINGKVRVIIKPITPNAEIDDFVSLLIPIEQAPHWVAGNNVDFIVYSSAPRTPQIGTPQQEGPVAG